MDCLQVMEPEHHLVVHMNDQQKESLYLGLTLGFYKVGAANSSCNLHSKLNCLFATIPKFTDVTMPTKATYFYKLKKQKKT